jgi:DNA polymerase-3 subunit gamma/tau
MAGYLVLARKYRSTTFDELVGQEPISQTLKNAIATGRIAHAYLFTGTRGVGKTTTARILAKALNCMAADGPTVTPCNKCDACLAIARGEDIDVIEIDGASNRGIDQIRELRANVIFRPARSRYKIYYIDEVHMLTKEAFNALLKTLEEPPDHVKFIFATTDTEKMPATILSRCQRYDFRNIPARQIADHLRAICQAEKVEAADDALFRIARAGNGSMRDALSLLDQLIAASGGNLTDADVVRTLGAPPDEQTLALAEAIAAGDGAAAIGQLNSLLESGLSLPGAAAALGETMRNLMLATICGQKSDLIELPESLRDRLAQLARKFTLPTIVQAVAICHSIAFKVKTSSIGRALLEAMVVRLAQADKFIDPASLLEAIQASGTSGVTAGPAARQAGVSTANPSYPGRQFNQTHGQDARATSADIKKNVTPSAASGLAAPAAPTATPAGAATPPATTPITWTQAWLASNWKHVIAALDAAKQLAQAGLLNPAQVQAFDGKTLTLGYPGQFESVRTKCIGLTKASIETALSELAGREISCNFVPTGDAAGGSTPDAANPLAPLSSAQTAELQKDPAIQEVLKLFGGELAGMTRESPATSAPPAGEDDGRSET